MFVNGTVILLNKGSVFVTDGVSVGSSYYIGGVLTKMMLKVPTMSVN